MRGFVDSAAPQRSAGTQAVPCSKLREADDPPRNADGGGPVWSAAVVRAWALPWSEPGAQRIARTHSAAAGRSIEPGPGSPVIASIVAVPVAPSQKVAASTTSERFG